MKDAVLLELANRWELEAKAPDCEDGSEAAKVSNAAGHAHRQAMRACADTLRSPEPGFFIVGSKSYGRRNDYLLRVGWQQVDEILSLLE